MDPLIKFAIATFFSAKRAISGTSELPGMFLRNVSVFLNEIGGHFSQVRCTVQSNLGFMSCHGRLGFTCSSSFSKI